MIILNLPESTENELTLEKVLKIRKNNLSEKVTSESTYVIRRCTLKQL